MRIAIDVQAAQWGGTRAARAVALAQALLSAARGVHELRFFARGGAGMDVDAARLADWLGVPVAHVTVFEAPWPSAASEPANAWRGHAAGLAYAAFMAALPAELVIVLDAAIGFADDGVFAAPLADGPALLALLPVPPSPGGGAERLAWFAQLQTALSGADAVLSRRLDDPTASAPADGAPARAGAGLSLTDLPGDAAGAARAILALLPTLTPRQSASRAGVRAVVDAPGPSVPAEQLSAVPGVSGPSSTVSGTVHPLPAESRTADPSSPVANVADLSSAHRAPVPGPGDSRAPRPRLAYVSPLPPAASGIADYSAELLPALAAHYDITVVNAEPALDAGIAAAFPVRSAAWLDANAHRVDRILYHFGNSPFHSHMVGLLRRHPGVVVLHDFYLGHLFGHAQHTGRVPMALWRALLRSHGHAALRLHRRQGEAAALAVYPCNLEVFAQADGVIVHSRHAQTLARTWAGPTPPCPVEVVPLAHATPAARRDRAAARARLGLAPDAFVVCSFGYAGAAKMSPELVEAWFAAQLPGARLVLVGGHQFEGEASRALEARIAQSAGSIQLTGYASMDIYRDYLAAADVAVQLRTQSRGETSRAVLDAMAHGVTVLANAHGSAAELPAETALLLPDEASIADIAHALRVLADDPARRAALAEAGARYVRERHDPAHVAALYRDAIERAAQAGPHTAAGRARAVVAALAAWREPTCLPTRAELERFARQLLRNHPQPQARGVPPETGGLARRGQQSRDPRGLRVLSLGPRGPLDARTPRERRQRAIVEQCTDKGLQLDVMTWSAQADAQEGVEPDALSVPLLPHAPAVPRRLAQALSVWAGARDAQGLAALSARLRAVGYDAIHLDTPFAWPLLRAAWAAQPDAPPLPPLVYEARCVEAAQAEALGDALQPAEREAIAAAEAEVLALAALVIVPDEGVRAGLVARGVPLTRLCLVPQGAIAAQSDPARSVAVAHDHLPRRPFALWISEDDAGARQAFLDLMGDSFAWLPPGCSLVVAGRVCDFIEQSPAFARWAGINRSRLLMLADADELLLSGARRHARVVLLLRAVQAGVATPDAQVAELLRDGRHVLASPAALHGLALAEAGAHVDVQPDPARLRERLAALLQGPPVVGRAEPPRSWRHAVRTWPNAVAEVIHAGRDLPPASQESP